MADKRVSPIKGGFCPVREYTYDETRETEGVWFDIGESAKVKVARFGNPRYVEAYIKILNKMNVNPTSLSEEERDKLNSQAVREAFAEAILLGWENFVNLDGSKLKYSKDAAVELMGLEEFFNLIASFSQQSAEYHKYRLEDAVKN